MKKQFIFLPVCLLILSVLVFSFTRRPEIKIKYAATQKCLIVSDIHFNLFCGSALNDPTIKNALTQLPVAKWKSYFENSPAQMTLNKTLLYQDANYAVLQSAINNMKMRLPHPAFIIIAGDFIWHGATPADSVLKRKSIQFIAQLFKENFPMTPIIPAMGNNDTYGKDYDLQDPRFLNDFASAWEPNLPKTAAEMLKAQGYYTYETGNLKLMVLNTAPLNSGKNYPSQADSMLKWMGANLANAGHKNVWIIMHILPGFNSFNGKNNWHGRYDDTFINDAVKYARTIKFMIASHTHFNDFKVVYAAAGGSLTPVSFMRIVPSIGSNHGNNPSFEVAQINAASGEVIHETNWYLNLDAISNNINLSAGPVTWADSLNLPSSLKLSGINARGFSELIDNIKNDKTGQSLDDYIKFYAVGTYTDTIVTVNHHNYLKYLKTDSLVQK